MVTLDPQTGGIRAEFVPESTTGGPGDKLHQNRAGYPAMAMAIDLGLLMPKPFAIGGSLGSLPLTICNAPRPACSRVVTSAACTYSSSIRGLPRPHFRE
jgi:hypothetical protein